MSEFLSDNTIIIVAEPTADVERILNIGSDRVYSECLLAGSNLRLKLFHNLDNRMVVAQDCDTRTFSVLISTIEFPPFMLLGAHLRSQLHNDSGNLSEYAEYSAERHYSLMIERDVAETICIGDFNLNPFDDGIQSHRGFHSISSRVTVEKIQKRTIMNNDRILLFNPSWSFMGDYCNSVAGSYFYPSNRPIENFWRMFDQAMISHGLLQYAKGAYFDVMHSISGLSLIKEDGTPDAKNYSDHLPVRLTLS